MKHLPFAYALTVSFGFLISAPAAGTAVIGDDSRQALDVLERTKTTQATYSLFVWNVITAPGMEPVEEWSAEFHSGDLHRVETPRDRLVANCRARTGYWLSLSTGELTERAAVANASCGVNTNKRLLSAEWLGTLNTPFGQAERVRVVDQEHVREYHVSDDGILLAHTYRANKPGQPPLIVGKAVGVLKSIANDRMFDPESLLESFVPVEFQAAPSQNP